MPFLCGGFPRPGLLGPMFTALERSGAAAVEIGIPFSDPIADGPVIAAAMHQAIAQGVTPDSVFDEVAAARDSSNLGIIAMMSVSLVHRLGVDRTVARAADAGIDGFIFPDLPLEESEPVLRPVRDAGLTATLLVAPTTPADRAARIAAACSGFVYLLTRAGLTGESAGALDVAGPVRALRQATDLPIACGFGISTAEHVRQVVAHADAAIVGSALVRRIGEAAAAGEDPVEAASRHTRELSSGLTPSGPQ